jgi:hypothetical protein
MRKNNHKQQPASPVEVMTNKNDIKCGTGINCSKDKIDDEGK